MRYDFVFRAFSQLRRFVSFAAVGAATLPALVGCGSGGSLAGSGSPASVAAVSTGPQLGYLWVAADKTLRPILGVPGASQIGLSLVPEGVYQDGAPSPSNDFALLVGADRAVYRMSLPDGTPVQSTAIAPPGSQIRFSPSGLAAVLYLPSSTNATVLTSLSTVPQVRTVNLASPVVDVALSDSGTIAAAVQTEAGAAIRTVTSAGANRVVATVAALGGFSFVASTENLLVADGAANSVTLVRSASTNPSAAAVFTSNLLKSPVAIAASRNGQWAVAANGGEGSVLRIDLSAGTPPQRIACSCQPTLVAAMAGNGVFRVTAPADAPVWIADAAAPTPAMLFIPAIALTEPADPAAKATVR